MTQHVTEMALKVSDYTNNEVHYYFLQCQLLVTFTSKTDVTSLLHSFENNKVYHKNFSELLPNYKALQPIKSYPSEKFHLTSDIKCLIL
jgi:hypothetical protein